MVHHIVAIKVSIFRKTFREIMHLVRVSCFHEKFSNEMIDESNLLQTYTAIAQKMKLD